MPAMIRFSALFACAIALAATPAFADDHADHQSGDHDGDHGGDHGDDHQGGSSAKACFDGGGDVLSCLCQNGGPCEGTLFSLAAQCKGLPDFNPDHPHAVSVDYFDATGKFLYTDNAVYPFERDDKSGTMLLATANLSKTEFATWYAGQSGILDQPGVQLKVYPVGESGARGAQACAGPNVPYGRALWAQHSGDTINIANDLADVK